MRRAGARASWDACAAWASCCQATCDLLAVAMNVGGDCDLEGPFQPGLDLMLESLRPV